jgi:hypothetical protein
MVRDAGSVGGLVGAGTLMRPSAERRARDVDKFRRFGTPRELAYCGRYRLLGSVLIHDPDQVAAKSANYFAPTAFSRKFSGVAP